MVVDTSAMVAILTGEPGGQWLSTQLGAAPDRIVAAPTVLELGIVLEARAPAAIGIAGRALRDAGVRVVPFDEELADRAQDAWRRFGKGRSAAALNLGDCVTYALAERTGYSILCVGDDFPRTDLPVLQLPD
ncbi:type II toxin-antitoxin system VapC family toxin [Modestobacter lapidis]|nr:type II toxin-antitoxin system VapC family toxin [Modestobacter lapidis]